MKYDNQDYFGFLLIDKQKGATSHDVVAEIRHRLRCRVGHTGTLDPFATGLLIIALGKATRLIEFVQNQDKEYDVTLILGEEKDSYDITGETIVKSDYQNVTREGLEKVLSAFQGEILQAPPSYSAIKVNGKRAYELARKGVDVELKKRKIRIDSIQILDFSLPEIKLRVNCSKGTYIRSLVHDIGISLGANAYAKDLRRTKIENLSVNNSLTLFEISNLGEAELKDKIINPRDLLKFMPLIELDDNQFNELKFGRTFDVKENSIQFDVGLAIYNNEVVAIIKSIKENGKEKFKPDKVFLS